MVLLDTNSHLALLRAISAGRPRQVRLLLESGIDVNLTDSCGQSPLIRAVFIEHPRYRMKIIRLLLRHGAAIVHRDCIGRSALAWACLHGLDCIVELLIKKGDGDLDLNDADLKKCTPLFHATTSGNAAAVKLLVDALRRYDLSVDIQNGDGMTPLMQAIRLGHDVCASILLHQGKASATVQDNDHRSALDWAELTSHKSNRPSFMLLIKKSPRARRPESGQYCFNGAPADDDLASNDEMSSVAGRIYHGTDGEESDKSMRSVSDRSPTSSCSSSSSLSYCDSSPETLRRFRTTCIIPLTIASEAGDYRPNSLIEEDNQFLVDVNKNHQSHNSVDGNKFCHLPELYGILSHQLRDTFRQGAAPRTTRPLSAIQDANEGAHEDCRMECCVSPGGQVLVPDAGRRQSVVQSNRKSKESSPLTRRTSSTRTSPVNTSTPRVVSTRWKRAIHSTHFPSLRQTVTKRRFLNTLDTHKKGDVIKEASNADSADTTLSSGDKPVGSGQQPEYTSADVDHHGNGDQKSNFPAIAAGKPSLVGDSGAVTNSDALLKRDLERVLATRMKGLSL